MRSSRPARTARSTGRDTRPLQGLTVFAAALLVLGASVLVGVPGEAAALGAERFVSSAPVSPGQPVSAVAAVAVSRPGPAAGPSSTGSSAARAALPPAPEQARAPYLAAVAAFTAQRRAETLSIGRATAGLDSAGLVLADSAGRVLDETSRTALADGIRALEAVVARAGTTVDQANQLVDSHRSSGSYFAASAEFVQATDRLRDSSGDALDLLTDDVTAAAQTVTDAVAAWQAEQDRLAAEEAARQAAAEAARLAAEAAAAAANAAGPRSANGGSSGGTSGSAGTIPAPASATFDKYVWTNGFQSEIDSCNGAVDVTGNYGVAVIAEHWSCGGSWFPGSGSVITLSGVRSGTYRVGGVAAVLNANTQGTQDVPRGYDLLYQTCINGSNSTMSFTVLTRVG
ncbi:hypothetical protein E3T61_17855 [Cryobacterium lactosi]|uniref:Uncharacterized protein n=1 Tax=Cryobacterium lactosi TaxID=1259202 RepID=A0A4R9BJ21_9MICO|nr:hypothetical protein [Cryobacterium lactosi]TFD85420.1 hypothetical protein E3T61_17855 [Cryobacterium lactosi]